jgi:hypothetical protein
MALIQAISENSIITPVVYISKAQPSANDDKPLQFMR